MNKNFQNNCGLYCYKTSGNWIKQVQKKSLPTKKNMGGGHFYQGDQLILQKADCSKNHCTYVVKKLCQHPLCGEDCKAGQYGRSVVKNSLLGKQNNVKMLQWDEMRKDLPVE